jgi:hypothetical protein
MPNIRFESQKEAVRALLRRVVIRAGMFPTDITRESDVHGLIGRLNPVTTEHDLVRIGPDSDGGYLLPDDLDGIRACFSPGVGFVSEFELAVAQLGMSVFLADRSVDRPAADHPLFSFAHRFVGATSNDEFTTLQDWVESSLPGSTEDLMLQIDIEGYEYETFLATPDSLLRRFRIIVVEFHALDQLWNEPFYRLASRTFDKLLQTHACVHIHPNNCCGTLDLHGLSIPRVLEFTFLRRDRFVEEHPTRTFPNPLDRDNTHNPPLPLPACWYIAS